MNHHIHQHNTRTFSAIDHAAIHRSAIHHDASRRPLPPRVAMLLPVVFFASMALAACGDDANDAVGTPVTVEAPATTHAPGTSHDPTTDAPTTDAPTTDAPAGDEGDAPGVVTITAADFAFVDVPASIPVGSKLAIDNVAATELHEIVAYRVPDAETRSVAELLALPQGEAMAALGGAPRLVLLQAPGGADPIYAVGDGTLGDPGRYVILCGIPTGADPGEYLAAAAASPGGPPQGVAGGPPHLVHGMFAEFVVE